MNYEYGIMQRSCPGIHRENMTEKTAHDWIEDFANDCPEGNRIREEFYVVRRPIGEWEEV